MQETKKKNMLTGKLNCISTTHPNDAEHEENVMLRVRWFTLNAANNGMSELTITKKRDQKSALILSCLKYMIS